MTVKYPLICQWESLKTVLGTLDPETILLGKNLALNTCPRGGEDDIPT